MQEEPSHRNNVEEGEDDKVNYYYEFCRLYLTHTILTTQLK